MGCNIAMALAGAGGVVLLARFTSWQFAVFCYGMMLTGVAANESERALSADPGNVPGWMLRSAGRRFLSLVQVACPLLLLAGGIVWERWWAGLVGFALAGIAAATSRGVIPLAAVRILIGIVVGITGLILLGIRWSYS